MINDRKLVVVMPAYNASETVEKTYRELPLDVVDEVILVDDATPRYSPFAPAAFYRVCP